MVQDYTQVPFLLPLIRNKPLKNEPIAPDMSNLTQFQYVHPTLLTMHFGITMEELHALYLLNIDKT